MIGKYYLSNNKISRDELSDNLLNIIYNFSKSNNNPVILSKYNELERIVPMNLWFEHEDLKKIIVEENNKFIRLRYYKYYMLTPIVENNNINAFDDDSYIDHYSLYQPFYPETFYSMWEVLMSGLIDNKNNSRILVMCNNLSLGCVESVIMHTEMSNYNYLDIEYDVWITGKESKSIIYSSVLTNRDIVNVDTFYKRHKLYSDNHDYDILGQAYKITYIKSESELKIYDLIIIDSISLFKSICEWDNEEKDLLSNIFYIITAIRQLRKGGSIIIKLNLLSNESWNIILKIISINFREHKIIRPSILNPINMDVYILANDYVQSDEINSIEYDRLITYYLSEIYLLFNLKYSNNVKNSVTKSYLKIKKCILENLKNIISIDPIVDNVKNKRAIDEWHIKYGLKQNKFAKNIYNEKDPESTVFMLSVGKETNSKYSPTDDIPLRTLPSETLNNQKIYLDMLTKKSELNYYKRVMDTKPCRTFSMSGINNGKKNISNERFMMWEQVVYNSNFIRNLKYVVEDNNPTTNVTNAWLKLYEIIMEENIFENICSELSSFHICESPGAFINSTIFYCQNNKIELEWYAQSLKPSNSSINSMFALDDYFSLISAHPDRWLYGKKPHNNGNITDPNVIKSYIMNPKLKNIEFMTADGGTVCAPYQLNEQEMVMSKIFMGQILCILGCLKINGTAIIKYFLPMTEPLTMSLIYILTLCFDYISVVKPSTSHPSNSEVYIVLKKYRGINSDTLNNLLDMLEDPLINSKTFLLDIEKDFISFWYCITKSFMEKQIVNLCKRYHEYYHQSCIKNYDTISKNSIALWLKKCGLSN